MEPPRKFLKQNNNQRTSSGGYRSETGNQLLCRIQNSRADLSSCLAPFRHQMNLSSSPLRLFDNTHTFGTGDVLEISGPPASGKSSLLLGIVASCLIPKCHKSGNLELKLDGPELSVLFLDCDAKFSIMKLMTMTEWLLLASVTSNPADSDLDYTSIVASTLEQCMESFQYSVVYNSTELYRMLRRIEEAVTKRSANVKIVVIDSISSFYWVDKSDNTSASETAESNCATSGGNRFSRLISNRQDEIIKSLRRLSKELGITIIFSNPVLFSDRMFISSTSKLAGLPFAPWNSVVTHKMYFNKPYKEPASSNGYENLVRSWAFEWDNPDSERANKVKEMPPLKYVLDNFGFIQLISPHSERPR